MSTTTFKGARYILKFEGDWDSTRNYEALCCVKYNAYSYISKQPVPAGVQISNTDFWLLWADPNAQFVELKQITEDLQAQIGEGFDSEYTIEDLKNEYDAFHLHQDDYSNDVIQPVIMNRFPTPPEHYLLQGCTADNSGYIYVAYRDQTHANNTIVRKYAQMTGDGSNLTLLSTLTLNKDTHANSMNIYDNKLYIADTNAQTANKVVVVDLSTFEQLDDLTLPGIGVCNCDIVSCRGGTYLVGHYVSGLMLLMYQYNIDLTRPDAYMDYYNKAPVEANMTQGCCSANNMFYELHSYDRNTECRSYILAYDLNDCSNPIMWSVGTPIKKELEDIFILNGHMYAAEATYLYDLGTKMVNDWCAFSWLSWYNPMSIWKASVSPIAYYENDEHTVKFPYTIQFPSTFYNIYTREPERLKFQLNFTPKNKNRIKCAPFTIREGGDITAFQITGTTIDFYTITMGTLNSSGQMNLTAFVKVSMNLSTGVCTATTYPDFEITAISIWPIIESKD